MAQKDRGSASPDTKAGQTGREMVEGLRVAPQDSSVDERRKEGDPDVDLDREGGQGKERNPGIDLDWMEG